MVEIWRGGMLESSHSGHAVICDEAGDIVASWGDPSRTILPRSACKMIQALALVESGAADAAGLGDGHLALACASHKGAAIHTDRVARWLADIDRTEADLRCGPQIPDDPAASRALICSDTAPCQIHNNCSGKHTGFLTLARHLKAGPEYIDPDHPVQRAAFAAFEEVTGEDSPGWAIDGCSAPNQATSVYGLARAMSRFAAASDGTDRRSTAMVRLRTAMMAHPELVSGEGWPCTSMMRANPGKVAVKTGAEGVYVAILPEQRLGIALKVDDGADRGSIAAILALLVRVGAIARAHPVAQRHLDAPLRNRRGIEVGELRIASGFG